MSFLSVENTILGYWPVYVVSLSDDMRTKKPFSWRKCLNNLVTAECSWGWLQKHRTNSILTFATETHTEAHSDTHTHAVFFHNRFITLLLLLLSSNVRAAIGIINCQCGISSCFDLHLLHLFSSVLYSSFIIHSKTAQGQLPCHVCSSVTLNMRTTSTWS